jgi:hypothetical protein
MKLAGFFPAEMLDYARVKPIVRHRRTFRRVTRIAFAAIDPRPCYHNTSEQEEGQVSN